MRALIVLLMALVAISGCATTSEGGAATPYPQSTEADIVANIETGIVLARAIVNATSKDPKVLAQLDRAQQWLDQYKAGEITSRELEEKAMPLLSYVIVPNEEPDVVRKPVGILPPTKEE